MALEDKLSKFLRLEIGVQGNNENYLYNVYIRCYRELNNRNVLKYLDDNDIEYKNFERIKMIHSRLKRQELNELANYEEVKHIEAADTLPVAD